MKNYKNKSKIKELLILLSFSLILVSNSNAQSDPIMKTELSSNAVVLQLEPADKIIVPKLTMNARMVLEPTEQDYLVYDITESKYYRWDLTRSKWNTITLNHEVTEENKNNIEVNKIKTESLEKEIAALKNELMELKKVMLSNKN
jgi:hypothetical protein